MKANFFLMALCIFMCTKAQSQITLRASDFPNSLIGTDSLRATLTGTVFPSLVPATNAMWDMSGCSFSSPIFTDTRIASVTGAQFADSTSIMFSSYQIQSNVQKSIVSNGYIRFGELINRKEVSLTAATGGSNDSLVIDSEYVSFSTPDTILKLPATYLTYWSSSFSYKVNFHISIALLAYSNAPGYIKTNEITIDTVTGWGQMRVVSLSGSTPSPYLKVLQVKSLTYVTDSFFVNGSAVSNTILGVLGVSQGTTDTFWEQNYYRPAEVTPLAFVSYNSNFVAPQSAKTHGSRLFNESVNTVTNDNNLKIFPNPTANRTFTISLPESTKIYTYELMDMNRRVVMKNNMKNNLETVTIPAEVTPGIYFLRILENGVQFCVRGIDVAGN